MLNSTLSEEFQLLERGKQHNVRRIKLRYSDKSSPTFSTTNQQTKTTKGFLNRLTFDWLEIAPYPVKDSTIRVLEVKVRNLLCTGEPVYRTTNGRYLRRALHGLAVCAF